MFGRLIVGRGWRTVCGTLPGAAFAALTVLVILAGPAEAASPWRPVASGTTQDITAVAYRADGGAWFGTGGGELFTAGADGRFHQSLDVPGVSFESIAFQPAGPFGYAVTDQGTVFRSSDAGVTWQALTPLPPTVALLSPSRSCSGTVAPAPAPPLYAVTWTGTGGVYITGGSDSTIPTVYESIDATAPAPSFFLVSYQNGGCAITGGAADNYPVTGAAGVRGSSTVAFFVTQNFGKIFRTDDAFISAPRALGSTVDSSTGIARLAVDPSNPADLWVVDTPTTVCPSLCFTYSRNGGASSQPVTLRGVSRHFHQYEYLLGVADAGRTLIAVGPGGALLVSHDGTTARQESASGALASTTWRAVGVADTRHALVGGDRGRLVREGSGRLGPRRAPTPAAG